MLKWIAIGMFLISFCSSLLLFSLYSSKTRNTFTLFSENPPLPPSPYSQLQTCAKSIAVFSAIGLFIAILLMILSAYITSKPLDIIFTSGIFIFALSVIISEVMWYVTIIYSNNALALTTPRNISKVQKYIKNSIKELYQYAYDIITTDISINSTELLNWEDFETKLLGQEKPNEEGTSSISRIYQYSDIYQNSNSPILDKTYISLYSQSDKIYAQTANMNSPIQIGSLSFITHGNYKIKSQVCWPSNSHQDFQCKILESDSIPVDKSLTTSHLLLETYLVSGKYLSNDEQKSSLYTANYLISFPVGYIITGKSDQEESYDEFSNSYRGYSVETEFKKYLSYLKDQNSLDKASGYYCQVEPRSYQDINTLCDPKMMYLYLIPQNEDVDNSFTNVGIYPNWAKKSAQNQLKESIFQYGLEQEPFLTQIAIGLLCINAVAFVLLVLSFVSGFFVADEA